MKDYKQLLKELPSSTVVCAMGEFDPPTVGHEMLVKTVKRLAEEKNSAYVIFTHPPKNGILQEDKKGQYLTLMFPKTNFQTLDESFAKGVAELKKKYKNVIVVAGSDQMASMKRGLKESVEFIAITEKDPDANETKMKSFASKALFEEFKKKLPTSIRELDGKRLMNDVRQGMGLEPIKEQLNLVKDELREQYFRGEIFNVGDIVESNEQYYQIVKRGSNHLLLKEESGELVSKWIQDVKVVDEGVIQPNGTDKVETNQPEKSDPKDQNGNPIPRSQGVKKGFLTFYSYTKDQNDFKVAKMEQYHFQSKSDSKKDTESDLDADGEHKLEYDPSEVGNTLVKVEPEKGSSHLRRQRIKYAFKEAKEKDSSKVLPHDKEVAHLKNDTSRGNGTDCAGGSGSNSVAVRQEAYKKKSAYEKINNRFKTLTGRSLEDAGKEWEQHRKDAEERLKQYQQERGLKNEEIEIPKDAPSVEAIAKKHGVSEAEIEKQLAVGMRVEAEHGKNPGSEREIAMDHLNERPDYYKKLKKFVESLQEGTDYKVTIDHHVKGEDGSRTTTQHDYVIKNALSRKHAKNIAMNKHSEKIGPLKTGHSFGTAAQAPVELNKEEFDRGDQSHKVNVTVSDPNHTAVSQRKEKIEKRVVVSAADKGDAMAKAQAFYKKRGYKVHDVTHHSVVPRTTMKTEEVEQLDEGKMGQIHADIEDHLGKHLDDYKAHGGAEHFANKVMKTHDHIAKLHGLEQKHAAKLVNSYVDSKLHESALNQNDVHGDYQAKRKAIQDIQMDPDTHKDPELRSAVIQRKADLEREYEPHRIKEEAEDLEETKRMSPQVKLQRAWEREQAKSEASRRRAANVYEKPKETAQQSGTQKPYDPFFKEDELTNEEIDALLESVTFEDILELYEEDEIALIYEDTGEEIPVSPEEAQVDLMEVLSRQERMKAKIRFRRTQAKRERSTKIALKRYSPVKTINARARRLAVRLMKQRLLRGRNYQDVSVGEKERIDKTISKRAATVNRIAAKLVARIRRTEKSRMSHGTFTKGEEPKVF